ncbi:ABC transporter substrate-binding protein [Allofranklinella schreckenbergeri]|uniref:ABC transporter substrate-binding protein n=1 Tax=Allofranklinella schreckenbergeri TaxID=1076744 RepID=A0A3M6R5A8_9BURK|nr:ABC transporter substrate-binding protein [Allofranklinella schreckenbergeri]RMX10541.1 ABC transporter substrate-binding protein [Allofranklinella schreckenbergeri]
MKRRTWIAAAAAACLTAGTALAQNPAANATVTVGVSVSSTGPAASLGIPEKQSIELLPVTLGGLPVKYVVLDDATDPSQAAKNARRLVESDKADVIIGSSAVPPSLAIAEVAAQSQTPQIALAPFEPKAAQLPWVFPLPQSVDVMGGAIFDDMKAKGVKTVAFIGFADAWGEAWLKALQAREKAGDFKITASERYGRNDTSVTAQALKISAARPDAVLIGASGSPASLPMRALHERGYKGQIYQTHGIANNDYLRVAGKSSQGAILPSGPVLVVEQLDDAHPSKAAGAAYVKLYEDKHGAGSRNNFGAYAWDAYLLLDHAVAKAAANTQPGTPQFRQALREALEQTSELPVTHGVINMSEGNHSGFDARSRVLLQVDQGAWKLLK